MRTTQEEKNKVELFIRELRDLNDKGLIRLMEKGLRPDILDVDGKEVLRGSYVGLGYYVFSEG